MKRRIVATLVTALLPLGLAACNTHQTELFHTCGYKY